MIVNKQTYLFLSAQHYRMNDEKTGAVIEGITAWYVPHDNLDPEEDAQYKARGGVSRGKAPVKVTLPADCLYKLDEFPGLYEATFKMVTKKQQQVVVVGDIDFVGAVRLVQETGEQKQAASA